MYIKPQREARRSILHSVGVLVLIFSLAGGSFVFGYYTEPTSESESSKREEIPVLFKRIPIGQETEGIDRLTFNSIQKTDVDIRRDLYATVDMAGPATDE